MSPKARIVIGIPISIAAQMCIRDRYAITVGARSRETAETVLLYPMSYSV